MKKIIYSMSMAVAILFTACDIEKGTSYEVADANKDENVNPAHIRAYPLPGTAGNSTASLDTRSNNNATGNQATTNLSATELVHAYYNESSPEQAYRSQNYQFSSTQLMGGKAAEEGAETTNNNTSGTTMAPGSTTADGQSRGAADSRKTGDEAKRTPEYKKKPDNSGSEKKKRLTPYQ